MFGCLLFEGFDLVPMEMYTCSIWSRESLRKRVQPPEGGWRVSRGEGQTRLSSLLPSTRPPPPSVFSNFLIEFFVLTCSSDPVLSIVSCGRRESKGNYVILAASLCLLEVIDYSLSVMTKCVCTLKSIPLPSSLLRSFLFCSWLAQLWRHC